MRNVSRHQSFEKDKRLASFKNNKTILKKNMRNLFLINMKQAKLWAENSKNFK